MAILYHGSPNLFDHFELIGAGDGTGLKFGYGEYLVSAKPVEESIVAAVESKLGVKALENIKAAGKEFRKWIGTTLTGAKKADFIEEKKAAELLESIGVHYNVWPQAQNKPDGFKNIAVFDASRVKIVKVEEIEIESKGGKWILKNRKEIQVDSR